MKTPTYISLFVLIVVFCSCNGSNSNSGSISTKNATDSVTDSSNMEIMPYKINGTIDDELAAKTVLVRLKRYQPTTEINSGSPVASQFELKGDSATEALCYIELVDKGGNAIKKFPFLILEPGEITIHLGKKDTLYGTPANNQAFVFSQRLDSLNTVKPSNKPNAFDHVLKEGVRENIINPFGIELLSVSLGNFTTEEILQLYPLIPKRFNGKEVYRIIKNRYEGEAAMLPGKEFLNFEAYTPQGDLVQLSDYVGKEKIVLIDFWSSTCHPCLAMMPTLRKLYSRYKEKGFEIVGISLDETMERWQQGMKHAGNWHQLCQLGKIERKANQLYPVTRIPQTFLYDRKGRFIARNLNEQELEKTLNELLP